MSFNIDWTGLVNFLLTSGLTATAALLWRVSLAVERIASEQAAHRVLDDTRFTTVNQRIDELREDMLGRRGMH